MRHSASLMYATTTRLRRCRGISVTELLPLLECDNGDALARPVGPVAGLLENRHCRVSEG
jgi:hypothetical protein